MKKIKVSWSVTKYTLFWSVVLCCVVFGFSLLCCQLLCFSHWMPLLPIWIHFQLFREREREINVSYTHRIEQQHREVTELHNTKMSSLDMFLFSLSRTFCSPFAVYVQIQVFIFISLFFILCSQFFNIITLTSTQILFNSIQFNNSTTNSLFIIFNYCKVLFRVKFITTL